MQVKAGPDSLTISTTQMQYFKHLRATDARYGACFYEITAAELTEEQRAALLGESNNRVAVTVSVAKAEALNVYLYGGKDRFSATNSVIEGNAQVTPGEVYTVDSDSGFLLVAYPSDNSASDFEFTIGLQGYFKEEPVEEQPDEVVGPDNSAEQEIIDDLENKREENIGYIVSIVAVSVVVIIAVTVCLVCRKKSTVQILNEEDKGLESGQHLATISPRAPAGGNDTSMQIEDMEDD